jgi:hypothetical protein
MEHEFGRAAAGFPHPGMEAERVPAGDRHRLGGRQIRLHRELGPRQIQRVFPVAHDGQTNIL